MRLLAGLLKGLVVGGAVGYGLSRLGYGEGRWAYLACAAAGALAGLICGRPPWRTETIWTPIVKLVFGGLIGLGLGALGLRFLPPLRMQLDGITLSMRSALFLSMAVGVFYGVFVEIDDGAAAPPRERR